MDVFHRGDLSVLASHVAKPCVTIMMPSAHVEAELAQNPIRLKNLIKRAEEELKAQGVRDADSQRVLGSGRELLDRDDFWRKMSEGLAIFMSPEASHVYRLPSTLEETVVVNNRFYVKPLFPLILGDNRFYLLALSQNRVQFFEGTQYGMDEVQTTEITKSLAEALFTDRPEPTIKGPVGSHARKGRQELTYHGHGQASDDYRARPQEALKRFFTKIDAGVSEIVNGDDAPMVLAGVAYYLPIYREVNTYRGLVADDLVPGNWEHLNPKEMHRRAWSVVEPLFLSARETSRARFQHLYGNGGNLASTQLKEIVPAAVFHRVDTLFVKAGAQQWGRYDPDRNLLEIHTDRRPGDEDLLDLAAVHTYLNSGTVHVVAPDEMPVHNGPLAATFRYEPGAPAEEKR